MEVVEQLWKREKIRERLTIYCKAIDEKDWELLRSCFGPGHSHTHGPFSGDTEGFIEFAKDILENFVFTQHNLSNFLIELSEDGLSATSVCNFSAVHRTPEDDDGAAVDMIVEGQYRDRLVCIDGDWLFTKRIGNNAWVRHDPVPKI